MAIPPHRIQDGCLKNTAYLLMNVCFGWAPKLNIVMLSSVTDTQYNASYNATWIINVYTQKKTWKTNKQIFIRRARKKFKHRTSRAARDANSCKRTPFGLITIYRNTPTQHCGDQSCSNGMCIWNRKGPALGRNGRRFEAHFDDDDASKPFACELDFCFRIIELLITSLGFFKDVARDVNWEKPTQCRKHKLAFWPRGIRIIFFKARINLNCLFLHTLFKLWSHIMHHVAISRC